MKVWLTNASHSRFHTPGCTRLRQLAGKPIVEMELEDVSDDHEPCRLCWPDAPRPPKVWRPICNQCYGARQGPCPHNGGVLVLVEQRGRWPGRMGAGTFDPEATMLRQVYVWPENAYRYRKVEEDHVAPNARTTPDLRDRQRR